MQRVKIAHSFLQSVKSVPRYHFKLAYSPFHEFWQSFISIEVCKDCIPALASSCKKQLTGLLLKVNTSVKGLVKLIKRVKIAHTFLQSVSNQFHVIILSLPM